MVITMIPIELSRTTPAIPLLQIVLLLFFISAFCFTHVNSIAIPSALSSSNAQQESPFWKRPGCHKVGKCLSSWPELPITYQRGTSLISKSPIYLSLKRQRSHQDHQYTWLCKVRPDDQCMSRILHVLQYTIYRGYRATTGW